MIISRTQNSLYEVFQQYDEKIISVIFEVFKTKEENSYMLLSKKFGINLDGQGVFETISFADFERIDKIISRLRMWICYAEYLYFSQEKTLNYIYDLFVETNEEVLISELTNYQKQCESNIKIFSNKHEILTYYKITENLLSEAMNYISDKNERLVFKYTYGIGCNKKTKEVILNVLRISNYSYQKKLFNVHLDLPKLIKKVQTVKNNENLNKRIVQEKVKIIEAKPQEYVLLDTFFDYFITDEMNEIEKNETIEKVKQIIEMESYSTFYKIVLKIYGKNLNEKNENIQLSNSEKSIFSKFINKVKALIPIDINEIIRKKKNEVVREFFYKNFCDSDMTLEEKENITIEVKQIACYLKYMYPLGYKSAINLYGEDLNEIITKNKRKNNSNCRDTFVRFCNEIRKYIGTDLSLFEKMKDEYVLCAYRPDKFYKYFYKKVMTSAEEQKQILKAEKLVEYLKENYIEGFYIAKRLYGENLDEQFSGIKLDYNDAAIFRDFITICRKLVDNNLVMPSRERKKRASKPMNERFTDYFKIDESLEKEVLKIGVTLKYINAAGYRVASMLYGNNLDNALSPCELDSKQKSNFMNFCNEVRKYIGTDLSVLEEMKNLYVEFTHKPTYFYQYYYKKVMTEEELEIRMQKVQKLLEYLKNNYVVGLEVLQKLYGEDLNEKLLPYKLSSEETVDFRQFIRTTRALIDNNFIIEENKKKSKNTKNNFVQAEESLPDNMLIINLHNDNYSAKQISKKFGITLDKIVDCYIENMDMITDIEYTLDCILINCPDKLMKLLLSSYYAPIMEQLTEKEQMIVYLKFLDKIENNLTDEYTLTITGLSVEEIRDYTFITDDDKLNVLNKYLKKLLDKKEYEKNKRKHS